MSVNVSGAVFPHSHNITLSAVATTLLQLLLPRNPGGFLVSVFVPTTSPGTSFTYTGTDGALPVPADVLNPIPNGEWFELDPITHGNLFLSSTTANAALVLSVAVRAIA